MACVTALDGIEIDEAKQQALVTVGAVLVEEPVMLSLVAYANSTKTQFSVEQGPGKEMAG